MILRSLFALALLLPIAVFAAPKKIVLVAGKPSHKSGEHEFRAGSMILAKALNEQSGLEVEAVVSHYDWPEDPAVFEGADAVIIYADGTGKHPANGHWEEIDALAAKGVGIMCMHYAVHIEGDAPSAYFKKWIGGYYETNYSTNPHWTAELSLADGHPISNGVEPVTVNDEWYYRMRFGDGKHADIIMAVPEKTKINRYIHWTRPGEEVLGTKQTLMWAIERPDGGRGVGFTGGHWHRNWAIDEFRQVVLNAIVWCAKGEVPEEGVKSEPVSEAQLNENLDEKSEVLHVALPDGSELKQPAAKTPAQYHEDKEKKKK